MNNGKIALVTLVVATLAVTARTAHADCPTAGHCSATECEFRCTDTAEYIVFGKISCGGDTAKPGVCRWNRDKTTFLDYTRESTYNAAKWIVGAWGGGDLVRLASRSGESCGGSCTVDGDIDAYDTFLFYGDDGDDYLYLCATTSEPSASDCIAGGSADGLGDSDHVYGSVYADYLWGGDGVDYLYGYEERDVIHGGAGDDRLYGHEYCDYLAGDESVGDYDRCYCGPGGGTQEGETADCEYEYDCDPYCMSLWGTADSPMSAGDEPMGSEANVSCFPRDR